MVGDSSRSDGAPVVVVGAGGFIGAPLTARLAARGIPVVAVTRRSVTLAPGVAVRALGDLTPATDWPSLLTGARAVVHLASRAHVSLGANRAGGDEAATAAHLTVAARRAGVARILFMSSIKVLGETTGETPFRADQAAAPEDAYGLAKWRIEGAMRAATADGPSLTIIRPPLVYGPGVKANFRALLRLVDSGLPLPFASVANRRSLIFIDNLLDLIELTLDHPAAPEATFLVRDDEDVATPELMRRIARQFGHAARLFPCPPSLLRLAARAAGRTAMADRLLGSLRIDDRTTRERLGWRPRVTLDEGLAATCRWYRQEAEGSR